MFDLLSTVEYGGCSAKLSPKELDKILAQLPCPVSDRLMVSSDTSDDAAVYRLNDEIALIFTTDFFPPLCSDPYEFGQIAATNSLSDIYAMGGTPLMSLNLIMFPSTKIPSEVLLEILKGGQNKVSETGSLIVGGHTIDDYPPKYGLAVIGTVHPDKIITNSNAKAGDVLILTKALGMGIIIAGKRLNEVSDADYQNALSYMKLLNKKGCEIMQKYSLRAATDITGFGLLGHALKMAKASEVSMEIYSSKIPVLNGAYDLAEMGCIPGGAFRNQDYCETSVFSDDIDYQIKMIMFDAQTSGGLLMCAPEHCAGEILSELKAEGYPQSAIIGKVIPKNEKQIHLMK